MSGQFILYDPADLARVASGDMNPWEPQPYATIDIDDRLLMNPAGVEEEMLGSGVQRRFRIGAVAYDRAHDLLYVLEPFADEAKPVIQRLARAIGSPLGYRLRRQDGFASCLPSLASAAWRTVWRARLPRAWASAWW